MFWDVVNLWAAVLPIHGDGWLSHHGTRSSLWLGTVIFPCDICRVVRIHVFRKKNGQTPSRVKKIGAGSNTCVSDHRLDKNQIHTTEKSPNSRKNTCCMFVSSECLDFLPKSASRHILVVSKVRSLISGDLLEVLPMKGSWTAHDVIRALRLHRPAPHLTLRLFVGNEPMDSDREGGGPF